MNDNRIKRSSAPLISKGTAREVATWKIAAVAMLGSLLAQLDATIVNVSLTSLAADLRSTISVIQWVTSGYLLALALALPLNNWLIEKIGAKALYLWCFAIFTISSGLCGLSWSAGSLIGFRILQGASGGLLAPMAQLMIKRAAKERFTRIAGYATAPVLLGPVLGPVIAGEILHYASWRWLFLVNIPIGILALFLAMRFLPDDAGGYASRKLDWMGLALLSPGLALMLIGPSHIAQPAGMISTVAGAALLVLFVRVENRKGDDALIDIPLFRQRAFSAASVTRFFSSGTMYAGQMLIPMFLMQVYGLSPPMMGWMLMPMGLGMMAVLPSLGFLTHRFGERRVAVSGAALSLLSTLALVWQSMRGFNEVFLIAVLFFRGMGLGAVGLPAISLAYASIPEKSLPMATTTLNIVQRIGGPTLTTFCALFLSWALQNHVSHFALNAWSEAFFVLCMLHAVMVFATLRLPSASDASS
jgi:EmrB/QacA subfamily drug resistance transporter